ncbi:hypothetical protein OIDMADRAFT_184245 [Oidiodendron maius Zn]|uniref:F-box domain-containing protein n=1 Tax=Oidiodendron maius (strain Zn) TaxID=913774 RepID=A0A0C3GW62_OIDMZ|nr:hypothetical protein OIDMADRAFT_184245 [Oidiodendron maius Zn]
MSYNTLPNEIVVEIAKFIRRQDVKNFAIINKRTYNVSYDRLEELRVLRRRAKTLATRFALCTPTEPRCVYRDPSLGTYGLPPCYASTSGPGPNKDHDHSGTGNSTLADSEYLELNGDLHWLQPLSESALECHEWPQGEPASKEHLDELVLSAKRVGVEIPQAFLTFMGSKELIERMWLGGNYFFLGQSLVKCNPEDDKEGGGYAIRFFCDQQGCEFWSLYVAPGGHHGVLRRDDVDCWLCSDQSLYGNTGAAVDNHPNPKLYEGVPIACKKLDLWLDSPNFELWLAVTYFSGCGAKRGGIEHKITHLT